MDIGGVKVPYGSTDRWHCVSWCRTPNMSLKLTPAFETKLSKNSNLSSKDHMGVCPSDVIEVRNHCVRR